MDTEENRDNARPLTTGQIAQYCHVTHRAVLKWVASGKLPAYRTPGNHSRVSTEDFIKFLKVYQMPVPLELEARPTHKKVLIVDDDRGIVHSLKRALMINKQYEVQEAFDGFEAGGKFASFKPDFLILDIRMPGVDGHQVCSDIRRDPLNRHVKILAITGHNDPQEIKKIMDLGADGFLVKPFSNKILLEKIEAILGKGP